MELGLLDSAILVAIANGVNTVDALEEVLKGFSREAIENKLAQLEARGLVRRRRKGLIIKREVYELTEEGARLLDKAYEKLREAAKVARELAERQTDKSKLPENLGVPVDEVYPLISLLTLLGMLDAALLPLLLAEALDHEPYDMEETGDLDDTGSGGETIA